ncbi:MAG TPA: PEP-CTERM sorting domain-containing protein [Fimbriimonadaceae bacterium]|nr:PEP-CTERM sorting domain-containing protein [Fimbriimonadaceae bacterium]
MKRLAVLLCACSAAGAHAVVVLDNFTDAQSLSLTAQGSTSSVVNGAGMVGGSRRMGLTLLAGIPGVPISASSTIGSGFLDHRSSSFSISALGLTYGGPLTSGDLNLNLSGENRFRLSFHYNDIANTDVQIEVRTAGGGGGTSSLAMPVPRVTNPSHTVDFMFANFVGTANFGDVDEIRVVFSPMESGDFLLAANFQAVPEPGTMIAVGLGVAALAARRRLRS